VIKVFSDGYLPEDQQIRTTDGRLLVVRHIRAMHNTFEDVHVD